jgi:hypothetical protein
MKKALNGVLVLFFLSLLFSCKELVSVQKKSFYEAESQAILKPAEIYIYSEYMDKFSWVSPEPTCVELKINRDQAFEGKNSIHLKWDKITGGCKWLGVGFGAGNWYTKDFSDKTKSMALQLQIKAAKGSFKNFPVAFAFEDNFGVQAYFGFRLEQAAGVFNDSSWTSVTIPLSKFDFKSQQFNIEKITQFIIQLEAEGDVYLDNIKFITLKNG